MQNIQLKYHYLYEMFRLLVIVNGNEFIMNIMFNMTLKSPDDKNSKSVHIDFIEIKFEKKKLLISLKIETYYMVHWNLASLRFNFTIHTNKSCGSTQLYC